MGKTAYIFDVDGVLSDPVQKQVTEPELLNQLVRILEQEDPLALNTGRATSWVKERVIAPLEKLVSQKSLFDNFMVVGEKGNTLLTFESGEWKDTILTSQINVSLEKNIREIAENEFAGSMFFDPDKSTMVSIEMRDGFNNDEYTKEQKKLHQKLNELLDTPEYKDLNMRIDPSQISLDIQPQDAGKHLGAVRIEKWFEDKSQKPDRVIMFGDSPSDIEMAEELQDRFTCEFVFVNDPHMIQGKNLTCKVTFTKARFTAGTLEYLQAHSELI